MTDDEPDEDGDVLIARVAPEAIGERLDRALADALPELSRARVQSLIAQGAVRHGGDLVTAASVKAQAGDYAVAVPAPVAAEPQPQPIPLKILYEDAELIVIDKPAGMAAHPAPGTLDGTLVNALLHHCTDLSGIGGVLRPGIVHRLDKDTSGVMVAAKTDAAHRALSQLFARHDIERQYIALTRGAPDPARGTIAGRIGRSPFDRKKMAVLKSGGREAVTHYTVERAFKASDTLSAKAVAGRVACRLETGRTHQIRVHLASVGAPCLGDPVYGSGAAVEGVRDAVEAAGLRRQALHAAVLGFVHPLTQEPMRFQTAPPSDMAELETKLRSRFFSH